MSKARQQTIGQARELSGVGLHTGARVRMRLLPGDPDSGVVFRRVDLDGSPEVAAQLGSVVATDRGTTIASGEARVHTVEHLLSAVAGAGVDNLLVEIDGPEIPAADGSAQHFLELLREGGIVEQDAAARIVTVGDAFTVRAGDAEYVVSPASGYEVSATVEFDHPSIGRQFTSVRVEPSSYTRDIAPARTFGFLEEVDTLRERGLAQGGSLENAVVLTADGLHQGTELRFPDEFSRHKALDVIGDLALLGARIQARVFAHRPSHAGNVALAREIQARAKRAPGQPVLTVEQIMKYLPHRYPFLLVDRVVEYEEGKRIVGLKNVTINEPFFVGHFPGRPTMPGVLIVEAMAQVGGLMVMDAIENPEDKIVYFMTLDNVKWRRPVVPGDQIRFEVTVVQIRGATARMRGIGIVDGQVVAEADMMARIVDR